MRTRDVSVLIGAACLAAAACSGADGTSPGDAVVPAGADEITVSHDETAEPAPVSPECLPTEVTGWSRAGGLPPALSIGSLAANEDLLVAAGVPGPRLEVVHSVDGLAWEQAEGTSEIWVGSPTGPGFPLAGGPQGFVVATTPPVGSPVAPVVVFSPDGLTWEQVEPESLPSPQVAWLTDVFAGPDGFLIVGTGHAPGFPLLVWSSSDGRSWTETNLPPLENGSIAVTATESGWAALTVAHSGGAVGESGVRVWTSPDGRGWSEVETETVPPDLALLSYVGTAPLRAVEGNWVLALVGAADDSPGPRTPTVWVSADDGVSWSEHTVWDEPGEPGFAIYDASVTDSGLLLAGQQDKLDDLAVNFVHHSQEGTTWQHCWTGPREVVALEGFGDRIAAVDSGGDVFVWDDPAT